SPVLVIVLVLVLVSDPIADEDGDEDEDDHEDGSEALSEPLRRRRSPIPRHSRTDAPTSPNPTRIRATTPGPIATEEIASPSPPCLERRCPSHTGAKREADAGISTVP